MKTAPENIGNTSFPARPQHFCRRSTRVPHPFAKNMRAQETAHMATRNLYEMPCYTYFVSEGPRGPIKIGSTTDPARRLATMQIGNSQKLKMFGLVLAKASPEARWHQRFAAQRLGGEWFKRTPELLAAIAAEATHRLLPHSRDGLTTRMDRLVLIQEARLNTPTPPTSARAPQNVGGSNG
ncbi:GIY-YIG nuclease family protein [Sphingomonas baiyangensis]|uniref:GIY-YIG nuclease family protein n=1 Tax=Sphingomonas baiyangensis TaxID=2572576 RepID=A0A4U1L0V8_9SPHN|nr:GIY-YIG nuclease family protein [Sphingomonas baiyangensis]TKD50242.1 GIY-YIG nuclease family protein [Sphingomonas baiyangensis]